MQGSGEEYMPCCHLRTKGTMRWTWQPGSNDSDDFFSIQQKVKVKECSSTDNSRLHVLEYFTIAMLDESVLLDERIQSLMQEICFVIFVRWQKTIFSHRNMFWKYVVRATKKITRKWEGRKLEEIYNYTSWCFYIVRKWQ